MGVAWVRYFAGQYEDAIREALQARDLGRDFEEAGNVPISAYEFLGRYEEAMPLMGEQPCWGLRLDADQLRAALRQGGPAAYWKTRVEQLDQPGSPIHPSRHFALAIAQVQVGDTEGAI